MNLLIRKVRIADPRSSYHQEEVDLHIRDGRIEQIGPNLTAEQAETRDLSGAMVSPGWLDVGVQTGDPGYEQREDLDTVTAAAARGGYTAIASQPNTLPIIASKAEVQYIRNRNQHSLVECYPIGALTRDCQGKEITEMIDMRAAGAIAFSDGKQAVLHSGVMLRALQYVKQFDGLVIHQPHDDQLAPHGHLHEGEVSTILGMPGLPNMAEELMVQRDLALLAYTGSRLHLSGISSAGSVALIREAKIKGLRITASVPVLNLLLDDSALMEFDVNCKVRPPLRSTTDREALIEGLLDGTIDFVHSNHVPVEEERKKVEFPYAAFGAIGLETAFAALHTALAEQARPEQWVKWLSLEPRRLLGLETPALEAGAAATLTFFAPQQPWTVEATDLRSRSRNSPLIGRRLSGRVLGIIHRAQSDFSLSG